MCGSPEVRTAIRLLFVGDTCSRALKAACAALTRLLHKHPSSPPTGSRSWQCGLLFPVGRIHRCLMEHLAACRVDVAAAVSVAAVLEFLCTELLRHACDASLRDVAATDTCASPSRSPMREKMQARAPVTLGQVHVDRAYACDESLFPVSRSRGDADATPRSLSIPVPVSMLLCCSACVWPGIATVSVPSLSLLLPLSRLPPFSWPM